MRPLREVGTAVVVLACVGARPAPGAETYWQRAAASPGDWFTAGNWDSGVPASGDRAYIENGGTIRIASGGPEAWYLYVGNYGTGSVEQSGGNVELKRDLRLGEQSGADGTYTLTGGTLSVHHAFAGMNGMGRIDHSGGRLLGRADKVISGIISLGNARGSWGSHDLSGSGELEGRFLGIGTGGTGRFTQSGGTCTIRQGVAVGSASSSDGRLDLRGGSFVAAEIRVGDSGYACTGLFAQRGGSAAADWLVIGPQGRYEFSAGNLALHMGGQVKGEVDFGASGTPSLRLAGGILDLTDGDLANVSRLSFSGGDESLLICPPGLDPSRDFLAYSTAGFAVSPGGSLVIPAGRAVRGCGTIPAHVENSGILTTNASGTSPNVSEVGGLDIVGGLLVSGGGKALLSTWGDLWVNNEQSGLSSGEVSCGRMYVGHADVGRFRQTSGTNTVIYELFLGVNSGAAGTYELTGGTLDVNSEIHVGGKADGQFVHTGGQIPSLYCLSVGGQAGTSCSYWLGENASLSTRFSNVGGAGAAQFTQTGGTHRVDSAVVVAQNGTYELSGGSVTASRLEMHGQTAALFAQGGGTHTVGDVRIADATGSVGTYRLQGGQLASGTQHVGYRGTGTFVQTGGTNRVSDLLILGKERWCEGTYDLHAGTLTVDRMVLGLSEHSTGRLILDGGRLDVADLRVGAAGHGALNIAGSTARMEVSGLLRFGGDAALAAVPGTTIRMAGSAFENTSRDPNALEELENVSLVFEGGLDDWGTMEVAGADLGLIGEGFESNFLLGSLVLGGTQPARLRLLDDVDNGNRGSSEALYVHDLTVGEACTFDLNGLSVYYDGTFVNLGAITNGYPVPEPLTLALLAVGGLVLTRRGRRGERAGAIPPDSVLH